ncbi:MAG: response regulator, partial [Alphaproteobacteria bacterium]|nr:response regulator [Alphaproteobacteria bacterium]
MSGTTTQPNPPGDGKRTLRVLVVEDSEFDARMLVGLLRAGGFEPEFERVETAGAMRTALGQAQWEVILADYNLPK